MGKFHMLNVCVFTHTLDHSRCTIGTNNIGDINKHIKSTFVSQSKFKFNVF